MARLASALLLPLGAVWDLAGRVRGGLAQPYRAPVPVLCVGNIVAGGAGKTPVVLSLAALAGPAARLQIVSRGYRGRLAGPVRVDLVRHAAAAVGDEPLLIAARTACWVARDRAAGVRAAVGAGADAVLLDDGLQNPAVEKDLSFVVVDAEYGFGNGRLIPAGPLREPVAAGLARAGAVVLLGDGPEPAELRRARCPVFRAQLEAIDGERFAGMPVVAFAGIGRPDKFFATLRSLGARLEGGYAFADHHNFTERDIARLQRTAASAGARLVTTAKDWVRLPPGLRDGIEVLEVEIRWQDRAAVAQFLAAALRRNDNGHEHRYERTEAAG